MNRASSSSVGSRLADMSCRLTSETCSGLRVLLTNSRAGRAVTAVVDITIFRRGAGPWPGGLGLRVLLEEPSGRDVQRLGQAGDARRAGLMDTALPVTDMVLAGVERAGELLLRHLKLGAPQSDVATDQACSGDAGGFVNYGHVRQARMSDGFVRVRRLRIYDAIGCYLQANSLPALRLCPRGDMA